MRLAIYLNLLLYACSSSEPDEIGLASFYSDEFAGEITASGEPYDPNKFTAAHRDYPFGTQLKIKNLSNGQTVIVTINDRGPFVEDRIIDLSKAAAEALELTDDGVSKVSIKEAKAAH